MAIKTLDRRNTGCVKWDECETPEMLPLWVADMDFETAPCVYEAVQRRAAHGIYGYTFAQDSYFDALTSWFSRRHGWNFTREQVIYTTGVVPAISAIIAAMTRPGDEVVTLSPMYNCFFSSIRNKGCRMSASELLYNREEGSFSIDFENLERRLSQPKATVMLLCNPHNPTGRVWTPEELRRIGDLCLKHDVFVISDEIHCEFVMPGHTYTPYASLGDCYAANCAVCTSPSKAFNIAGLQVANIIVPDARVRRKVDRAINDAEVCDLGVFGPVALEAAYNGGEQWLEEVNEAIASNYSLLCATLGEQLPQVRVCRLEGTYLPWLDCSALIGKPGLNDTVDNAAGDNAAGDSVAGLIAAGDTAAGLTAAGAPFESTTALCGYLKKHGVWLNPGDIYSNVPSAFVRINIACSKETLSEALRRIADCL